MCSSAFTAECKYDKNRCLPAEVLDGDSVTDAGLLGAHLDMKKAFIIEDHHSHLAVLRPHVENKRVLPHQPSTKCTEPHSHRQWWNSVCRKNNLFYTWCKEWPRPRSCMRYGFYAYLTSFRLLLTQNSVKSYFLLSFRLEVLEHMHWILTYNSNWICILHLCFKI